MAGLLYGLGQLAALLILGWGLVALARGPRPGRGTVARAVVLVVAVLLAWLPSVWRRLGEELPGAEWVAVLALVLVMPILALGVLTVIRLRGPAGSFPLLLGEPTRFAGWSIGAAWALVSTLLALGVFTVVEGLPANTGTGPMDWQAFAVARLQGVVWAPFLEELMFRGLCLGAVLALAGGRRRVEWLGIVIIAVLWAAGHDHQWSNVWVRIAIVAGDGVVLGWLARRYSLEASLVSHGLGNAIGFPLAFAAVWLAG